MDTVLKLGEKQLKDVIDYITEQLRVRSIFVTLTLTQYEKNGKQRLELTSTPFNTVPVIHSEIRVTSFGGEIYEEKTSFISGGKIVEVDEIRLFVSVHASYEGNGVELFTITGRVDHSIDSVYCETK